MILVVLSVILAAIMSVEAKRLYVVGGTDKVQETQMSCFTRNGLNVVQIDMPTESPLSGFEDAKEKNAQYAVVNIGRHEVIDGGKIGEDIVGSLMRSVPRLTIVTFSLDVPSAKIPGIYAHVQRTFQTDSYIELADKIAEAPQRKIDIFTKPEYL